MNNWLWPVLGGIVLSIIANELCDLFPWAARIVVRWAARVWTNDNELALTYLEEWTAVIDARPGKALKLATALGFLAGAVWNKRLRAGQLNPAMRGRPPDRRLFWIVISLSLLGFTAAGIAGLTLPTELTFEQLFAAAISAVLVAVSVAAPISIRIRSAAADFTWCDMTIVLSAAVLPQSVAILTVFASTFTKAALQRSQLVSLASHVAHHTLMASAATVVFTIYPSRTTTVVALAFIAVTVVGELTLAPVSAHMARTTLRQAIAAGIGPRAYLALMRLLCTILITYLLLATPELIIVLATAAPCLHLAYRGRQRVLAERDAGQKLAETTSACSSVDLETTVRTAIVRGAELFQSDHVELVVWADGRRLVGRGDRHAVTYLGTEPEDEYDQATMLIIPLGVDGDGSQRLGELRLHVPSVKTLSPRDRLAAAAFARALTSSIRNATAFARLAKMERGHRRAAHHDPLTGLADRRKLFYDGSNALRHNNKGVALMLLDVDACGKLARSLGPAAADRLRVIVATRLLAAAGTAATIAWLADDQFAILWTDQPSPPVAYTRAHQLLVIVGEPFEISSQGIRLSASSGLAFGYNLTSFGQLFHRADIALSQAKQQQTPVAVFTGYTPYKHTSAELATG